MDYLCEVYANIAMSATHNKQEHVFIPATYQYLRINLTMLRGKITFKCDNCGHTFEALDIEWQATVYSQPMPCPNCGSRHTMPKSMFILFTKGVYRKIWEEIDNS